MSVNDARVLLQLSGAARRVMKGAIEQFKTTICRISFETYQKHINDTEYSAKILFGIFFSNKAAILVGMKR